MSSRKWGESFLKSGLPLEHLTLVTFKSLGWDCDTHIEYKRYNREQELAWFELDLAATSPNSNKDTELSFLVECKYHDLSRFWFFLPYESPRFVFNDRVLNCGPVQTLAEPRSRSILDLTPHSIWGIVVSEDGTKQDNAVHTAIQQLAHGFVPYCLSRLFGYNIIGDPLEFVPDATAMIPMIVTNANIYRLNPKISDLELIRKAAKPSDIADELEWTWCYFEPSKGLLRQNQEVINTHKQKDLELVYRFPIIAEHMGHFFNRPNWIAVVNIRSLSKVIKVIARHFYSLPTLRVKHVLGNRMPKRKTKTKSKKGSSTSSV